MLSPEVVVGVTHFRPSAETLPPGPRHFPSGRDTSPPGRDTSPFAESVHSAQALPLTLESEASTAHGQQRAFPQQYLRRVSPVTGLPRHSRHVR